MIVGRSPILIWLDRGDRLNTELAEIGHRAIRVEVEPDTERISRDLVEVCGFHDPHLSAGILARNVRFRV
jgi:hypothetical protein